MNASTRSRCEAEPDFAGFGYNLDNRGAPRGGFGVASRRAPGAAHEVENWAIGGSTSASVVGAARRGAAGFEILLRLLRARAAVVDLELALPAGASPTRRTPRPATRSPCPRSRGLSWRARRPARWPEVAVRGRVIPERHPNWAFHQLVADWLAQNWRALAADDDAGPRALQPAGPSPPRTPSARRAERLRRRGAARRGEPPASRATAGGLRTTRRASAAGPRAGAAITFAVEATAAHALASWDPTMGRVAAALDGGPPVVLDARRPNSTVSLTSTGESAPAHDHRTSRCDAPRRPSCRRRGPGGGGARARGLAAANVKDRYAAEDELKRARAPPGTKWWAWRDPALVWRNLTFVLLDPGTRFVIRYLTTC
ncbi:cGMP-dependent protein kinase [Aureococcus anophagefferens]|nr:cGMP-dependent protein kinase [Aureococcus anophagefferens]